MVEYLPAARAVAGGEGAADGVDRREKIQRIKKGEGIYLLLLVFYSYLAELQCVRCCQFGNTKNYIKKWLVVMLCGR